MQLLLTFNFVATCSLVLCLSSNGNVDALTSRSSRRRRSWLVSTHPRSQSVMMTMTTTTPVRQSTVKLRSTSTERDSILGLNATELKFASSMVAGQESMNRFQLSNPLRTNMNLESSMMSVVEDKDRGNAWLEPLAWRGVILLLCALWASNFAAAKLVMAEPGVDSGLYALARFGVAATALAPGAIGAAKRANMDWETLKGSLICGSWVAFGYLGQTLGLMTTTASKSCVICSMHCVFVAGIAELWRVQRSQKETEYDLKRLLPALLAVVGVAIVELSGAGGAPTVGDALSFAQPIGFGMGYLQLEELMSKKPEAALPVSALKLFVVATASLAMFELSPIMHGGDVTFQIPDFGPILSSPLALGGILYTGLVTTAFALWVESTAFAKVPATDASIILTTEPLIAAGLGAVALGETFGASDYVGATLIIGACALAVLLDAPHEAEYEAVDKDTAADL